MKTKIIWKSVGGADIKVPQNRIAKSAKLDIWIVVFKVNKLVTNVLRYSRDDGSYHDDFIMISVIEWRC